MSDPVSASCGAVVTADEAEASSTGVVAAEAGAVAEGTGAAVGSGWSVGVWMMSS